MEHGRDLGWDILHCNPRVGGPCIGIAPMYRHLPRVPANILWYHPPVLIVQSALGFYMVASHFAMNRVGFVVGGSRIKKATVDRTGRLGK
jgi:hypothetical protein